MFSSKRIGAVLLGAGLPLIGLAQAETTEMCGKAKIVSGEKCKDLVIEFDVRGCEPGELGKVQVTCRGRAGYAKIKAGNSIFRVNLKKESGAWGDSSWKTDGPVSQTVREPAVAKKQPSAPPHAIAVKESEKPSAPAQPQATPPPPPVGPITISGLFDGYYSFNFNRPSPVAPLSSTTVPAASISNGGNNLRYYDIYHNKMSLSLAELTVKKTGTEVSFLVDLDFGEFADQNVALASPSTGPTNQVVDEVSKHIGQAFVTYTPNWLPGLTMDFGKMPSHIGYEVMKSRDNWQYSRSTTFGFGSPFWHTGLHVGYAAVPGKLTTSLYLYNGWNSVYDNNHSKTLGAQIKFTPLENLTIIYNVIGGAEQEKNEKNKKIIHEANVVYSPTSTLSFALELLTGREAAVVVDGNTVDATWRGITIHAKAQPHPRYWISPRYEVYRDDNGYTVSGGAQTIHGVTLTNSLDIGQGLEARLEGRYDISSYDNRFARSDGLTKKQTTMTFALIYTL